MCALLQGTVAGCRCRCMRLQDVRFWSLDAGVGRFRWVVLQDVYVCFGAWMLVLVLPTNMFSYLGSLLASSLERETARLPFLSNVCYYL